jgi:hypothetical protein
MMAVMRDLVGQNLALVESGRAGDAVCVMDAALGGRSAAFARRWPNINVRVM